MVAKVLFRRAKALFEDFQYEMALSDIQRAALIVDNDKVSGCRNIYVCSTSTH